VTAEVERFLTATALIVVVACKRTPPLVLLYIAESAVGVLLSVV
jgi:hypothetical protein